MAIPNVKRFRPFCPTCNETFTLMAVLPKNADVKLAYCNVTVALPDPQAYQDMALQQFKDSRRTVKQRKDQIIFVFRP